MNRTQHMKADMLLLGYTNEGVHALIDIFVKYLGAGHRVVRHNYDYVVEIERLFGNDCGRIALLHILIDSDIIDRKLIEQYI